MVRYDPFARGPFPVGVQTLELTDAARGRTLPVEVSYPADAAHAGADLDPKRQDTYTIMPGVPTSRQAAVRGAAPAATEPGPLICFSHGLAGHRRQSTFFTTHLASHGYVVIAPDHVGNTLPKVMMLAQSGREAALEAIAQSARDRVLDVPFLVESFFNSDADMTRLADPSRVGITGHSFGGWTTVASTSGPSPALCALPLAPIGTNIRDILGENPYAGFDLGWGERVPTRILAADRDSLCTLRGIRSLHAAFSGSHDLLVLRDADHFHFCDRALEVHRWYAQILEMGGATGLGSVTLAPAEELVGETPAHDFIRGAGLAHFDAHLRGKAEAGAFLANGALDACAARGATVTREAAG